MREIIENKARSVADRVDEIEDLIAQDKITRAQVFTQMKQLMLYTRSDINKIKADAVREYGIYMQRRELAKIKPSPEEYASKLEQGEL